MKQKNFIDLEQISFDNKRFWAYFLSVNYPCAYLEKLDCKMYDIIENVLPIDMEWSDKFTQYYDGVIEDNDGYIDNPTTLFVQFNSSECLKIEFHPGDTIFYINDEEIGCTGPHWKIHTIPYQKIKSLLCDENGQLLFQLLLPMADLKSDNIEDIKAVLKNQFIDLGIKQPYLLQLIECLISGILNE